MVKIDFYCEDCNTEKWNYEIAQYPFTACPICHSEDEDAIVWWRISEPCCPKCSDQNPIFHGFEVLEEDDINYESGTIINFYKCNCGYRFCLSKSEESV